MTALTRTRLVAVLLALILPLVPLTPASAAAGVDCADTVVCPPGVLFGASLPGLPRDLAGLRTYGSDLGRQPTIADYFAGFPDQLDGTGLTALVADHRLPMVTWSPDVKGNTGANPYPLRAIAAGTYDAYLTAQARTLAAVPGRVALRFAHEMNASWFPWGRGVNGNTDADYVAAYRHVHDVVTAAGATNVIWVWSPAVLARSAPLAGLYPGAGYVDWVGPDLYLPNPTDTLAALWTPVAADLNTFAADKPLVFAEVGVAPGSTRPAQIADLVGGLLHTPRLAGLVWFEEMGSADWRVDGDPAARAALAAQLADPWFAAAASSVLPPLYQAVPTVSGAPRIGTTLTATPAAWRTGHGTPVVTGRWYRCSGASDPSSCAAIAGATAPTYTAQPADWHSYTRYREHAVTTAGSADAWSVAGAPVQTVPRAAAPPVVTAYGSALQVTFPAVPFGANQWLLTLDGKAMVPIPTGTATYWLLGLTNGQPYRVGLAAADSITSGAAGTLASPASSLVAVPLAGPSTPYLTVTGGSASFQLPRVPSGAQAWVLTVDGVTTTVPLGTATWTAPALTTGTSHTWSLAPAAGTGGPAGWGSLGAPSTGAFVALDTPPAPLVTPVRTGATFTFGALPAGATGWQLTVGATTYPVTTASSSTVTGYASGYAASWSLRAVTAGTRSVAVTGRFVPA